MSNSNRKYQNGLRKRTAVRALRARAQANGSLLPQPSAAVRARLGYAPHFILDTNVMFAVLEYWADELRRGLQELALAQPSLHLYLLDTVASECRGSREKQRLYDAIVFNGHNPGTGIIYPLRSDTGQAAEYVSAISAVLPAARPSDLKDAVIAGAALAQDMVVVTVNGADFLAIAARFPALRTLILRGSAVEARGGELLLEALQNLYILPS